MGSVGLLMLLAGTVAFIVVATAKAKLHPFFVLLGAAYGYGLVSGVGASATTLAVAQGFGKTLGSIGVVIAAGTVIGVVLERTGGAHVMAQFVLRLVGKTRVVVALSLTGFVVAIPVFCDSGFIILSSLMRSLAAQSGGIASSATALSLGLYSTHVFVPPTPGPLAAAGALGANVGTVMVYGLLVAGVVVAASIGFSKLWAGRFVVEAPAEDRSADGSAGEESTSNLAPWRAFAPIVVPTLLIGTRSVLAAAAPDLNLSVIDFLGTPNVALLIGVAIAFWAMRPADSGECVAVGLSSSGGILLITGSGGALGAVLTASGIGGPLAELVAGWELGVALPFFVAAALKTAQGSSTVAIVTGASLVAPLLGGLGLDSESGRVLATLAIGAGGMTVSHANDSYFWVVSQFSGMTVSQAYGLHTLGSAVAGATGLASVLVLSAILL